MDPKKSPIPRILKDLGNDDPEIVKKAFHALSGVCFDNQFEAQNRQEIARAGGMFVIVTTMDKWDDNDDIQAAGCKVLQHLTVDESLDSILIEFVEKILNRMKTFPDHADLQKYACGALRNLSCNNKQHIKHLGGIEAVIAAMEGHLDDPRIQFAACYTLCNLASGGQEHAKAVITAGGLMSVTKAAQTHIEHKPVLRAAKDLQSILWNNIC